MTDRVIIIIMFLFLVGSAGCARTEPGMGADVSFAGTMNATESGYTMDSQIAIGGGESERETYKNVSIYLYSENKSLLYLKQVGTLQGLLNVSLSVSEAPYYVIISSPDFWADSALEVAYYEKTSEGTYDVHYVSSKDDLPVVSNEK